MKSNITNRTLICPGCGVCLTIDTLKKHLKKVHGFQEPFSLSKAVYELSGGQITATDLYSENTSAGLNDSEKENSSTSNSCQVPAGKSKTRTPKKLKTKKLLQRSNNRSSSLKLKRSNETKSKDRSKIVCILCGEKIQRGQMLEHKREVHGEDRLNTKHRRCYRKSSQWIQIVSGGLPGLGKRNR